MTQEEIIEMAEKSRVAFASDEYPDIWQTYMHVGKKELEAFAKLVASAASAKEREFWIEQSIVDIEEAVRDEREACIALIKSHGPTLANGFMLTEAIRERGEA